MSLGWQNIEGLTKARLNRTIKWFNEQSSEVKLELIQLNAEAKKRISDRRADENEQWIKLSTNATFKDLESVIDC